MFEPIKLFLPIFTFLPIKTLFPNLTDLNFDFKGFLRVGSGLSTSAEG